MRPTSSGRRSMLHLAFHPDDPMDVFATSSDSNFELEAGDKPSWVTKLTNKVRKTFCLYTHVEKKLYNAHVNDKLARHGTIQIMRALKIYTESGSEKTITPEEKCIYEHNTWTDDEASGHPTDASSARATNDNMEYDDETEDDDDDDSKDTEESEEDD
ncbi:hypothetical protein D1007_35625 [Hordeum vulgare]|nr:hypothetical protein D1007_35625 [Hordeum vulgare]